MGVYLDTSANEYRDLRYRRMIMCHMIADSVDELFAMAESLRLAPHWFQPWSFPHFDLAKGRQDEALQRGAVRLARRDFVLKMRSYRALILTPSPEGKAEARRLWEMTQRYGGKSEDGYRNR